MRKGIVSAALALAVSTPVTAAIVSLPDLWSRKPAVKVSRLVDCEDQDVQPCITADDGKWRLVYSYSPYTSKVIRKCSKKVGAPCFRHRSDTYEYLWRWTL